MKIGPPPYRPPGAYNFNIIGPLGPKGLRELDHGGLYSVNNMSPPVLDWGPLCINIVSLEEQLPGNRVL